MLASLFDRCCEKIEVEYRRLEHTLGWRFLTSPKARFVACPRVALITMQPGGARKYEKHPQESSEAGCAYIFENWKECEPGKAPLQSQVRALFDQLGKRVGIDAPDGLLNESLTSSFIPFRSPTFAKMPKRKQSVDFSQRLWTDILREVHPKLIITIDGITFRAMREIVCRNSPRQLPRLERFPIGWGKCTAKILTLPFGPRLCWFCHLSRFKIFGRSESEACISLIMDMLADGLKD